MSTHATIKCPVCKQQRPRDDVDFYASGKAQICAVCKADRAERDEEARAAGTVQRNHCPVCNRWLNKDGRCTQCAKKAKEPKSVFRLFVSKIDGGFAPSSPGEFWGCGND